MKVETQGLFQASPNCLTLEEIVEYLDMRNYDDRKSQEEHHEMYEEGSIILKNRIAVNGERKNRVQIHYMEFERTPLFTRNYIVSQPSWLIVISTDSNKVWINGTINCYFLKRNAIFDEKFIGKVQCDQTIVREYSGNAHCPYSEFTLEKLESMLTDCLRNITSYKDEVRYENIISYGKSVNSLPIIMNG